VLAVFRFDITLVDPTPAALQQALYRAATAADQGGRGRLLRWPPACLAAFFAHWHTDCEGSWQWNGPENARPPRAKPRRRAGRGHCREPRTPEAPLRRHFYNDWCRKRRRCSVVATVWWSDCIGRRHQRVIGCQRQGVAGPPEDLLRPDLLRPALAQIYPAHTFRLTRQGQTRALVACACGAFGTAEEVGWMGDCCGPCHDRRELQDRPTPPQRRLLAGRGPAVGSLAFSADGRRLSAQGIDGVVRVWDVPGGQLRLELPARGDPYSRTCLSPDGTAVAVRTGPQEITVWDVATGMPRRVEPANLVQSFAYAPDGRLVVFSARQVSVWDAGEGWCEAEFSCPEEDCPGALTFTGEGTPLAVRGDGVTFRDVRRGQEHSRLRWPGPGRLGGVLAFAPDRRTLAVAVDVAEDSFGQAFVGLWDTAGGAVRLLSQDWLPGSVQFSPDGRRLVTAKCGLAVQSWDVSTGAEVLTIADHSRGLSCVALSPDGRLAATGGVEGEVKLWPAEILLG
jgi:hypothetical protein